MTATDLAEAAGRTEVDTHAMCDICGHQVAAHDHIATRFCKATMSNALSRHCICR